MTAKILSYLGMIFRARDHNVVVNGNYRSEIAVS